MMARRTTITRDDDNVTEYEIHVDDRSDNDDAKDIETMGEAASNNGCQEQQQTAENTLNASSFPTTAVSIPNKKALATLLSAVLLLVREIRLQKKLTCRPLVYCQSSPLFRRLLKHDGILTRPIVPLLFVGTHAIPASVAAYTWPGPKNIHRRREVLTMSGDGARIALDWEYPTNNNNNCQKTDVVVLILHGINNDASFGYMRRLMKSCTDCGYVAVGMNFRGCGGEPLTTPRGYNAAYTGDLRCVVQILSSRNDSSRIFIVGHSLGANIVAKYLGEEGYQTTLPTCVMGGIALGNPLHIHSAHVPSPWGEILALGIKKLMLRHYRTTFSKMTDSHFRTTFWKAMGNTRTIGQLDHVIAPQLIRNESDSCFPIRIGYESGEEYWNDASSYHWIPHIPVPFLSISSMDDFLVTNPSSKRFGPAFTSNPNVMMLQTKCGGHLGWQEQNGGNWANRFTCHFIHEVCNTIQSSPPQDKNENESLLQDSSSLLATTTEEDGLLKYTQIRSKL